MRAFCWTCHRPGVACFCALARPFASAAEFALIVHPYENKSTVGTAWILRRSISNLHWIRSAGEGLDADPRLAELLNNPATEPLLLFPGVQAFNLSTASTERWRALVPPTKKPLFVVLDGTWTQAAAILRKSTRLQSLPRVSFETVRLSEYGFKKQPHAACLSSVEGVHRVIELLAERSWSPLPAAREHDQMLHIFRRMVRFQLAAEEAAAADLAIPSPIHAPCATQA